MTNETDLESSLEALAQSIAAEAATAETLSEKIQAFRALTSFWAMRQRMNPDDDNEGAELHDIGQRISAAARGNAGDQPRARGNGLSVVEPDDSGGRGRGRPKARTNGEAAGEH